LPGSWGRSDRQAPCNFIARSILLLTIGPTLSFLIDFAGSTGGSTHYAECDRLDEHRARQFRIGALFFLHSIDARAWRNMPAHRHVHSDA
jgi:hypothetical protein